MNNFLFLQEYLQLQYTIMFDRLINLGFATVGYCKTDKSAFWNLALTNRNLSERELSKIESCFSSLKRSCTIYFENRNDLRPLKEFLEQKNYKKEFEDCWMFNQVKNINTKYFNRVQKVENARQLQIFLKTFDNCFQKNDPQNPYGKLGDYLKVAEKVWYKHHETKRLEYFMVYKNSHPVAVSTLTNYKKMGYISNVGSLREVRGEGFGKAISLYAVQQSINHGNKYHCLATEEGCYPNEFYKRIGFKTLFMADAFSKEE